MHASVAISSYFSRSEAISFATKGATVSVLDPVAATQRAGPLPSPAARRSAGLSAEQMRTSETQEKIHSRVKGL